MVKLVALTSKEVLRKVKKLGYVELRQTASHIRLKHNSDVFKKPITIPFHAKDLGRGLLRKIIRDLDISIDEFNKL